MLEEEIMYKLQEIRYGMEIVDVNIRNFRGWWEAFEDYARNRVTSLNAVVAVNQLKRLEELIERIAVDIDDLMCELRGDVNGEAGSSEEDG